MTRYALIGLLGLGVTTAAWAEDDGIYADFATSLGKFTVQLDFEHAPRAVANFVGLATGAGGWLDLQSNVWHRPFYDGSIIHRVVKDGQGNGIAIQGGGLATVSGGSTNFTNAGYTMLEGVTNGLTHTTGAISMANSGPNTDGSQFFIVTTPMPEWDEGYTVFGHVTAGMDVVNAIAAVPVEGERPVQDILLVSVAIRRAGAAAEAFDIAAQGVPSPESVPVRLVMAGADVQLDVELASQTRPLMFSDAINLSSFAEWDHQPMFTNLTFYTGPDQVLTQTWAVALLGPQRFFHCSRIRYPVPLTTPATQRARTFTFDWNLPDLTYQVTFASNRMNVGTGWVQEGTNAPYPRIIFIGDSWTRDAYMGRLGFVDDLGREYQYNLGFNPGQATNRFTGAWWAATNPAVRYSMTGSFTVQ